MSMESDSARRPHHGGDGVQESADVAAAGTKRKLDDHIPLTDQVCWI